MESKKLSFALEGDLIAWTSYAASLDDSSVTAYINAAIRKDMEGADETVKAGFLAYQKAREAKEAGR